MVHPEPVGSMPPRSAPKSQEMRLLALIPARAGSKRIPNKNMRLLAGKPLIVWTIEAARRCRRLGHVLVSTDSPAIAEIARAGGADVPFLRPAALATGSAPMVGVARHAVSFVEGQGRTVSAVVTLQPTSPLRTAEDIDAAIELFSVDPVRALVSLSSLPSPQEFLMRLDGDVAVPLSGMWPHIRSQDAEPVYTLNGAIFITPRSVLDKGSLVGERPRAFLMPRDRSIDIDDEVDWRIAEALLR